MPLGSWRQPEWVLSKVLLACRISPLILARSQPRSTLSRRRAARGAAAGRCSMASCALLAGAVIAHLDSVGTGPGWKSVGDWVVRLRGAARRRQAPVPDPVALTSVRSLPRHLGSALWRYVAALKL